jgi:hypothetical protein
VNAMDICRVISLLLLSFFASFFSISTSWLISFLSANLQNSFLFFSFSVVTLGEGGVQG